MKKFLITYKELNKYNAMERHKGITLSQDVGDLSIDAKNALGVFIASTGNLKRNEIISIQELDDEGNFVGEPIKPTGEDIVIPIKK